MQLSIKLLALTKCHWKMISISNNNIILVKWNPRKWPWLNSRQFRKRIKEVRIFCDISSWGIRGDLGDWNLGLCRSAMDRSNACVHSRTMQYYIRNPACSRMFSSRIQIVWMIPLTKSAGREAALGPWLLPLGMLEIRIDGIGGGARTGAVTKMRRWVGLDGARSSMSINWNIL